MLRYLKRVRQIREKIKDPFWGSGYFVREVEEKPILQWRDAEGEWHNVETVREELDGTQG